MQIVAALPNGGAGTSTQCMPLHSAALRAAVLLVNRPDLGVNVGDLHVYCVPSNPDSFQYSAPLIGPVRHG